MKIATGSLGELGSRGGLDGLAPLGLGVLGGCNCGRGGVLLRFGIGLGGVELRAQRFGLGGGLLPRSLGCGLRGVGPGLVGDE